MCRYLAADFWLHFTLPYLAGFSLFCISVVIILNFNLVYYIGNIFERKLLLSLGAGWALSYPLLARVHGPVGWREETGSVEPAPALPRVKRWGWDWGNKYCTVSLLWVLSSSLLRSVQWRTLWGCNCIQVHKLLGVPCSSFVFVTMCLFILVPQVSI